MMSNKKIGVLGFIKLISGSDKYIETIYSRGGCYKFYEVLNAMYPSCTPLINKDKDHVATQINGVIYDITGIVEDQEFNELTSDDVIECESWSFASENFLSIGECLACEEPILALTKPNKGKE